MKEFCFDPEEALLITSNIINRLKNIYKDDDGYYFYGGTTNDDIECDYNREIILDNESRLRTTFKNHHNWSNMRKSLKPVENTLWTNCEIRNLYL